MTARRDGGARALGRERHDDIGPDADAPALLHRRGPQPCMSSSSMPLVSRTADSTKNSEISANAAYRP